MKRTKRFFAVFLSLLMMFSAFSGLSLNGFAAEIVESGPCGSAAAYTLDSEGNLVITGTGTVDKIFSGRTDIKTVVIEDGITSVCNNIFERCTEMVSAVLSNDIAVIPFWAFANCLKLSEIRYPDSLSEVQDYAFMGAAFTGELRLPEGLQRIGAAGYITCQAVTGIFIPASVTEIGKGAFASYGHLEQITVDENNPSYCSVDGSLFSKDMTQLLCWASPEYDLAYEIPATVSYIDVNAFSSKWGVNSFYISESNPYFSTVDGVLFNKDQTVLRFFPSNGHVASYKVPETVTKIAESAFFSCYNLKYIILPDSLTEIENNAFATCVNLKSIRIPDGVEQIAYSTFNWCSSLKEITLSAGLKRVMDHAFLMCTGLKDVYFLGTEEEWNAITVRDDNQYSTVLGEDGESIVLSFGNGNEALTDAAVHFTFAKGDVDLDGHVTPADARLICREAVDLDSISTARGDMDGNEMITLADARLAVSVSVFLADPADLACATPVAPTFAEFEGGAEKISVNGSRQDDRLTVTFSADDFAGTTDGAMYIGYDPKKLGFVSASVGLDGTDADWESVPAVTQTGVQDGVFTFAFYYQGQAAAEETELVALTFDMLQEDYGEICYGFGDWNGSAAPAPGKCPAFEETTTVIEYNGHRYCAFDQAADWQTAGARCEELGGHLTTIGSAQENAVVLALCGGSVPGCWIGGSCNDGQLAWVTGEDAAFTNWDNDQPDNAEGNQHAVKMWEGGKWDDDFEESGWMYVCEWDSAGDCPWEASAVWQVVSFDGNGAEGEMLPQAVIKGEAFALPECVFEAPEGKEFGGWKLNDAVSAAGSEATVDEDVVFTAVWNDPGEAHEHVWDEGHITLEPTCTEDGQMTYTCAVCGETRTEPIPCRGHVYGEWTITKPATVAEEGEETRVCTVCGGKETRPIPKPEQTYTLGDVDADGKITSADARLALRASVKLEQYEENSAPFLAADVDRSGMIEASDARLILRVSVKLDTF